MCKIYIYMDNLVTLPAFLLRGPEDFLVTQEDGQLLPKECLAVSLVAFQLLMEGASARIGHENHSIPRLLHHHAVYSLPW